MRKSKNSTQKRNFKSKRSRPICVGTSDLSNDTKKHSLKSRETVPLRNCLRWNKVQKMLFSWKIFGHNSVI
jgi:hypothetical protein